MSEQKKQSDSVRGAAIALCMTVDELMELLEKREAKAKAAAPSSPEDSDLSKLRAELAFSKSEVERLKHELEHAKAVAKAAQEFIVVRW